MQIEADDDVDSGNTSDYTSGGSSYTQSVTSSVMEFTYENGRRYHSYRGGNYVMPNDETEQDRLDLYHHLHMLITGGKLHLAPVGKDIQSVLDCGTGTGIWAIQMAEDHPSAVVTGVDLSPIQPSWVVPNVKFEVDDLELDWTFPKNHYDLIYSKGLVNSIKNWQRYISQIYEHVKPGGYVELADVSQILFCDDETYTPDTHLHKWIEEYNEALIKAGTPLPDGPELKRMLEETGFEDVTMHTFRCPYGVWPKRKEQKYIGATMTAVLETGFVAYGMHLFTRYQGYSSEAAQELCNKAWAEVRSKKIHTYQKIWVIYGRKPKA